MSVEFEAIRLFLKGFSIQSSYMFLMQCCYQVSTNQKNLSTFM